MNINELIIEMNNNKAKLLKPEQVHAFLKKELNVIEYMSIKDKKSLVDDIVNECILYDDGVFKFDDIDKYICFTMKTIAAYTNIELSDDIENDYDVLCKEKLLNPVIDTFIGEYENVKLLLQMKCDYILCGNSVEAQLGRFLDGVLEKLDDVYDIFKNSIGNFDISKLPINKEDLTKLINLIGKMK
jgi:hypothetical protein